MILNQLHLVNQNTKFVDEESVPFQDTDLSGDKQMAPVASGLLNHSRMKKVLR